VAHGKTRARTVVRRTLHTQGTSAPNPKNAAFTKMASRMISEGARNGHRRRLCQEKKRHTCKLYVFPPTGCDIPRYVVTASNKRQWAARGICNILMAMQVPEHSTMVPQGKKLDDIADITYSVPSKNSAASPRLRCRRRRTFCWTIPSSALLELCMPSVPLHGTRARGPASQRATAVDLSSVTRQQSRVFQMFLGPAPRVHDFGSGIRWWQQLICCAMDGTHGRGRINAGALCSQPSAARSRTGPMLFLPSRRGWFLA
jgi:hypothetical protein